MMLSCRNKAYRLRLANGEKVVAVSVNENHIESLIAEGFLAAADEENREAIAAAIRKLLDLYTEVEEQKWS